MSSKAGRKSTSKGNKEARKNKVNPWKAEYYVKCYQLAKEGKEDTDICRFLGVGDKRFSRLKRSNPSIRKALEEGRKDLQKDREEFEEYIYDTLPPRLQKVWREIENLQGEWKGVNGDPLRNLAKKSKQRLFLHALVNSSYNTSEACRKVRVSRKVLYAWILEDKEFRELLKSIQDSKKDYFESALIQLVREGNASAILFVNRTLNKDRGYSEKLNIEIGGTVEHKLSPDDLDISLEAKKELLRAIQKREEQKLLPSPDVMDAEFEEKED